MEDSDAYIAAAAEQVGFTITEEQKPGVRQFLKAAGAMAALLEEVPLDPLELAPAPVYLPPEKDAPEA